MFGQNTTVLHDGTTRPEVDRTPSTQPGRGGSCFNSVDSVISSWHAYVAARVSNRMAIVPVRCAQCHGFSVMQHGKQANGTQLYRSNDLDCSRRICLLQNHHTQRLPEIKARIVELPRNECGVRDIVRVPGTSSALVIHGLTKGHKPPESMFAAGMCQAAEPGSPAIPGERFKSPPSNPIAFDNLCGWLRRWPYSTICRGAEWLSSGEALDHRGGSGSRGRRSIP